MRVIALLLVAVQIAACSVPGTAGCVIEASEETTVVEQWLDATLRVIRGELPAPTIHARNLYHLSAAMWDAWAAYDPDATGIFADVRTDIPDDADEVARRRRLAMSVAAHSVASVRYVTSRDPDNAAGFNLLLSELCGPTPPSGPGFEVGREVAAAVLDATADDGWDAPADYPGPVNPPMRVDSDGTSLVDPTRWQPLEFDQMVTQNGIPLDQTVQDFVGANWGGVTAFALSPDDPALDIAPPPMITDPATRDEFVAGMVAVLTASSQLDPRDGVTLDTGPASVGNAALGASVGRGYTVNEVTGVPYAPDITLRADHLRISAEYWADGPTSETPPGHWNTIMREVSDAIADDDLRIGGVGEAVDRLEWDVKLALAVNGALHDAAIGAWGTKARYDSIRPVSAIRWMAANGQSSDPDGQAFHPDGLPLVPDVIALITETSILSEHAALADHVGEIAVRAWAPRDNGDTGPSVRWILGIDWLPYQLATFVTPAFAGYVSGHSTFSRAAAEVLTSFTGSPWFPGGLAEHTVTSSSLIFEDGPDTDVSLQWASYRDAADEAGRSRIAGGIHPPFDDIAGRKLGASIGELAWQRAATLFG